MEAILTWILNHPFYALLSLFAAHFVLGMIAPDSDEVDANTHTYPGDYINPGGSDFVNSESDYIDSNDEFYKSDTNYIHSNDDFDTINPATGLPMVGGFDIAGNSYGMDDSITDSFDDDWNHSISDDTWDDDWNHSISDDMWDNSFDSSWDDTFNDD